MGLPNGGIGHEYHVINVRLRDREHHLTDPAGCERVRGDTPGLRIDRPTRFDRRCQRRRTFWLDADDPHAAGVPGGDASDQASAITGQNLVVDCGLTANWFILESLPGD